MGMVVPYLFPVESVYFCYSGAHAKFHNPTTAPSGRTSKEPEREGGNFSSHVSVKSKQIFNPGILIFLWVRSPCKISEPYDNPSGRLLTMGEKRKRKKNILLKIVAYISCSAGCTHFAWTKITPLITATMLAPLAHTLRSDQCKKMSSKDNDND